MANQKGIIFHTMLGITLAKEGFKTFSYLFRLAIMKSGNIICEGSPTELKEGHGGGYIVNVKMKNQSQRQDLEQFLQLNFGDVKVGVEKEKWISYNLNGNISEMLGILANAKNQFDLEAFTINMVSLEDVFLQVTKGILLYSN